MSVLKHAELGMRLEGLRCYNRRHLPNSNNYSKSLIYENDDPETETRKRELNRDILDKIEAAFSIMKDFYDNGFKNLSSQGKQSFVSRMKVYCERAMREKGSFSEKEARRIVRSNNEAIAKMLKI